MERKKICWVTPDCFVDCDIDIIPKLAETFDIHWIVLFNLKDNRFSEKDFEHLGNEHLHIEFLHNTTRARYPKTLLFFHKIKKIIKRENPDAIYFNVVPRNPYMLPLYLWLPKDKTIVTAHDGRVTASMSFGKITSFAFHKGFNSVKHVNMFSKYQAGFFNQNFPGKDITIIPLGLKDFGRPKVSRRTDCIGFVFFGTIHFEKGLDLLIEAANQLVEEGITGFKVSINGMRRVDWKIEDKIRHPEYFELNICNVPNEEIPNIFTYNHYAVYPYTNMSQSGSIICAYNYNTPVIVSDLPGFTDEMVEGVDGFSFKSGNVKDLKRVMRECINRSPEDYDTLQAKMKKHISDVYSDEHILGLYSKMFHKLVD